MRAKCNGYRCVFLLEFSFVEYDVLTCNRVVFTEREFLGLFLWILLFHIVKAGVGRAYQFNENDVFLSHRSIQISKLEAAK